MRGAVTPGAESWNRSDQKASCKGAGSPRELKGAPMTESSDLPKWRLALSLAALFLSSMCTMGDLVVSPVAADVYQAFADSPEWLVNLGVTGPALFGLPFGLATGVLCDKLDKKKIMVIGFAVFTLSAVFGAACKSVYFFVTMRLLATGVGWGITNTAALSILADLFPDEAEHGKYVGWYNSAMSAIGALLAYGAGVLAAGSWQNAYAMYLIAIPVLVMLAVFLPSFPPTRDVATSVQEVKGASASSVAALARGLFPFQERDRAPQGWWKRLAALSIQVFLVATLYFVILYLVALYVADAGVGNEAFSGMLMSIMTIGTALSSLVFGFFYKRFRNSVYIPALFAISFVFLALAKFPIAPVIVAALAIAGLAWPFYFCYFYTRCTEIVPSTKQSTATSIVAAADGLAVTASSFLLTGTIAATGGSCLDAYQVFGFTMLAIAIASSLAAIARVARRKSSASFDTTHTLIR